MSFEFTPVNLSAAKAMVPYFEKSGARTCDYSVITVYLWQEFLNTYYAYIEDCLVLSLIWNGERRFYFPLGEEKNRKAALHALKGYMETEFSQSLRFNFLWEEAVRELESVFPGVYQIVNYDGAADYIYAPEDLKNMAGRKFHQKRNHISKFTTLYPDWTFDPITKFDLPALIEFTKTLFEDTPPDSPFAQYEAKKTFELLRDYPEIDLYGGILRTGQGIAGYSIGEIVGDTLMVHSEKASRAFEGSYPMICREFARAFAYSGIKYINREEDMGDLGLRQSKRSYNPIDLFKKYSAHPILR